jgi:biotin transport system substrate-specific component
MVLSHAQTRTWVPLLVHSIPIAAFAALSGLAARVVIPLPFTPVPFTLQVFVVLLAGMTLGARRGAFSQLAYIAAITAGLPLDSRMLGPAVWLSPTAGYLVGFVAAAYVTGRIVERFRLHRAPALLLGGVAGLIAIYAGGVMWLTIFFLHGDFLLGLVTGAAPFLMVDLIKVGMAAAAAGAVHTWLGGRHGFSG